MRLNLSSQVQKNVTKHNVEFVRELASLLMYHDACGISSYPADEGIRALFKMQLEPIPRPEVLPAETRTPQLPQQRIKETPTVPIEKQSLATRQDIQDEVACCRACSLATSRVMPVAGSGGDKVRLLIVGDWLSAIAGQQLTATRLFGLEQDQMLRRMLTAIRMPMEVVFVTNVIKCAIPESRQPLAEHVRTCLSFLRRQIVVLRPEVICTMGMIATRALLERPEPLSRLRGRFHQYAADDGRRIPLLATYHPTYLLQNPEMKQATWTDLQLLAKHRQIGTN